jgi:SagB-type dehydrogenase family enzyme
MLYWKDGKLVFDNFAARTRVVADPVVCSILDFCNGWRSLREIAAQLAQYRQTSVRKTLQQLCQNHLLERSNLKRDPRLEAMEHWSAWNPAAGFFHFSTKDTLFALDQVDAMEKFKAQIQHRPMPLPIKHYPHARKFRLSRHRGDDKFVTVLKNRRTWRKFGLEAVPLEALAHILELTYGIQDWVEVPGLGRAAVKTSPSGGCLHPIEAYVLAQRVEGLKPGFYHYNAATHQLEWLRKGLPTNVIEKNLGHQWWFAKSAFLVVMTAVFGRTLWKYDFPRVYRAILIEAGHLCQTFCLTATWRGLAPFSTIACTDTQWEKWLGIDGVKESVIYVAGAGMRPKGDVQDAHIGLIAKRPTGIAAF